MRNLLGACAASEELTAAAELLTSELVTNLVVHVGAPGELVVRMQGDNVRIEVTDHRAGVPVLPGRPATATGGRGLAIVDAVSDAWGVDRRTDDGKTVWFELGP